MSGVRAIWTAIAAVLAVSAANGAEVARVLDHRMAAWHKTMTCVSERAPNANVSSYLRDGKTYGQTNILVKFAPRIRRGDDLIGATQATDIQVEDFPGGVEAVFRLGDVRVRTEVVPLFVGRDGVEWEGAACYAVSTDPPTEVLVGIGGQGVQEFAPSPDLQRDELPPLRDLVVEGRSATYTCGREDFAVCIAGDGEIVPAEADELDASGRPGSASPGAIAFRFPEGSGRVWLTYAETPARAAALAKMDAAAKRDEVDRYYEALLENRIHTPEPNLDAAFRSALYNLEYNWIAPYGWNECIHHWLALWHNQHTAGAEWIGQEDRSRLCTLTHAEQLLPDGAVPQFLPNGDGTRRDFGGSNQFWTWQARHYWRFTGDRAFAAAVAPALDRVLWQTLEEHDPDGNLLIGWGLQIGNQEDFIQFDHDGATPSIEFVNMMRTRVELAEALGDPETASFWSARIRQTLAGLRDKLWLRDLGRFAHYVDEHGKPRLDAQYHTFLYTYLWDAMDERDGYASLRHLRDRLTGADGEVYCSNNFPNHTPGTWGMQAGAAQQPWAAWTFSKAGRRNDTWRPLKAVSDWVMDANHRGAWPEISIESTPAYFTPPAGLFIAAVCEALFGLHVDAPSGVLTVSPSFPDHWPSASLNAAKYAADYSRTANRVEYVVRSEAPMVRRVRWSLPLARVTAVEVNGETTPYAIETGVERMTVVLETDASTETRIAIAFEPIAYELDYPRSVAEGEEITIRADRLRIAAVDDRYGVLSSVRSVDASTVAGRVQTGLLAPYLPYGRLGLLNFARRTLFLACAAPDGRPITIPVDITVLPRVEAAPERDLVARGDGMDLSLRVRNNTGAPIAGSAVLRVARHDIPFDLAIRPRTEETVDVRLPAAVCGLLSVGENRAWLLTPDGSTVDVPVVLSDAVREVDPLQAFHAARLQAVPLPEEDLSDHTEWVALRATSHAGPCPWPGWQHPMGRMEGQSELTVEALPGVPFTFEPQKMVFVGSRIGRPGYRVDLESMICKKVYLLVASFADNHDMFTPLGQVTVRDGKGVVLARTLHMPGDVDWWEPQGMGNTMGTARFERPNRFGLLPLLPAGAADWAEGVPPAFPQPEFWASSLPVRTPDCTFNVIEMDLGAPRSVTSVDIETVGVDPGFGLLAVAIETTGAMERLAGTPWMPDPQFREPRLLFRLADDEDLEGWELEGDAFSLASGGALFSFRSLHSLARGEQAVGTATSPVFRLHPEDKALEFAMQGGRNRVVDGEDILCIQLIDADTGEVLGMTEPPGTHIVSTRRMPAAGLTDRALRLRLVDRNADSAYAWIGLSEVRTLPME